MLKIKILAGISILLGLISLGWVLYDYLALTDIIYNYGQESILLEKKRNITMGFIPVLLFHFFFFATMYFLFDYLKTVRSEKVQMELELEKQKKVPAQGEISGDDGQTQ